MNIDDADKEMSEGFGAALAMTEGVVDRMASCAWRQDGDGPYDTDCGHRFEITEGTPSENSMKFCCYCGNQLEQVLYVEEIDND